ncbi:hypothetical protein BU26DRAFT_524658 [Trematosphaeria pertusa]|uniref:Letm1 RBD domain-containing protein n=1 Tax=Trematosphaeria pertusa TaxID=390896 RepID=A0A6A6HVG3_9PLEO|nr:uncharacterized protein BU26DRAFT_524658 [Trematosphaeria pertusa]KAF2242017.1 hypothetical protein BU26DRAFT_524658 [Trematosphaeria pertusa]
MYAVLMNPRPSISFFAIPARANKRVPSLQCRRDLHYLRAFIAPSTSCYHRSRTPPRIPTHTSQIIIRHASSAVTALKPSTPTNPKINVPAKSPSSNVPIPQVRAKVNPPPETHAPELHVPARKQGQGYISYLWRTGRAYITFYKDGIRNVRATARLAKSLREKAAKAPSSSREQALTRAEWQIVRRSRADIWRLPAFAAIVLVLGEWTPVIALYVTPLIPEPCRIPAQVRRGLHKKEIRRKERERRLAMDAARLVARDRKPGTTPTGLVRPQTLRLEEVRKMDLYTLLTLSTRLDCHSGIWDRLFLTPPKALLKWALRKKVEYLRKDDGLIERDGGWQALESKEIQRACVERGISVVGRSEEALRRELAAWFKR